MGLLPAYSHIFGSIAGAINRPLANMWVVLNLPKFEFLALVLRGIVFGAVCAGYGTPIGIRRLCSRFALTLFVSFGYFSASYICCAAMMPTAAPPSFIASLSESIALPTMYPPTPPIAEVAPEAIKSALGDVVLEQPNKKKHRAGHRSKVWIRKNINTV